MPISNQRPNFVRAYCVAETADGTKYEFECVEPAFVSIDMSVPSQWRIYDVPLDAIHLPRQMSCFEMSFRAQHNKVIHVTKTTLEDSDVNREDR
jgi:hypothetical protein